MSMPSYSWLALRPHEGKKGGGLYTFLFNSALDDPAWRKLLMKLRVWCEIGSSVVFSQFVLLSIYNCLSPSSLIVTVPRAFSKMYCFESFDIVFGVIQLSTLRYAIISDSGCPPAFSVIEILLEFFLFGARPVCQVFFFVLFWCLWPLSRNLICG